MTPVPSGAPIVDDGACFACGSANAAGLHLNFARDPAGTAFAEVVLDPKYQGYRGIAHGGVVMMLLDEAMAHAAGAAGEKVMTAAVAVRFRGAVRLGVTLHVSGRLVSRRGKILKLEAAIRDVGGATLATADGSFVSLGPLEPGSSLGNSAAATAV